VMNNLADYFDAGGRVVLATFKIGGYPSGPQGRFDNPANGYMFFDITTVDNYGYVGAQTLGTVNEPASPLMVGVVNPNTTDGYSTLEPIINGGIVVANWNTGRPFIVRGLVNGRNRVDLNLYPNTGYWNAPDTLTAIKN